MLADPKGVKRRESVTHSHTQTTTSTLGGKPQGNPLVEKQLGIARQVTVSEGHHWPPPKGSNGDFGGAFYSTRSRTLGDYPMVYLRGAESNFNIVKTMRGRLGALAPKSSASVYPAAVTLSESELDALGTTAIARTTPTNPTVDAMTFLGETVREGIPSVVGSQLARDKTHRARSAGSEYLNVEFGWLPFISDIRGFAKVVTDSDEILRQYHRDSGRNVRRRLDLSNETETVVTYDGPSSGNNYIHPAVIDRNHFFGTSGHSRVVTTKSRRVWFSGCFTYYLSPGRNALERSVGYAQDAKKLLGVRLTPDVLWELAPWSWAVDWQTNTGDVISNFSSFASDNLVLRYGYVMCQTEHREIHTVTGLVPRNGGARTPSAFETTIETTWKSRRPATPYGFGFDLGGLSARQSAILVALGLTKGGGRR